MKLSDYMKYIGKVAELRAVTGLVFQVEVLDVKQAYGNVRFEVVPVAGSGRAWVSQYTLKF